jgi:hypothetical protein
MVGFLEYVFLDDLVCLPKSNFVPLLYTYWTDL